MNGKTNFEQLIQLPQGENPDEWIAFNIQQIYVQAQLFNNVLKNNCQCPSMHAGDAVEYFWVDQSNQIQLSAQLYITNVLESVENALSTKFPQAPSDVFPIKFCKLASEMLRRLLRIFIHAYIHHQKALIKEDVLPEVVTCLKYIITFGTKFSLLTFKDTEPIQFLVNEWNPSQ
ncbi:Mob1/phocein family protein [Spironucleus salmonicida]|uniref:Mob1/phocein family protein n=1 Tax=Spironucleus salmonicida TaxID=348837 RepID=V6LXC1_9EUKA|nr:Mob1/phocein family protein [Spironucleus salmonicida]|eukprot:EST49277.1 Mob1/phocein family protein [Spironucleus salmonicida]